MSGATPRYADVTVVLLAGGQGQRMGGQDKGLLAWQGETIAAHILQRVGAQAGARLISANRNLAAYGALAPVIQDAPLDGALWQGPLAGVLAALEQAATPWALVVPCDTPFLPVDLLDRLYQGAQAAGAALAVAAAGGRRQPVCMLVRTDLAATLRGYLMGGGRKVAAWQDAQGAIEVDCGPLAAFDNLNHPADWDQAAAQA